MLFRVTMEEVGRLVNKSCDVEGLADEFRGCVGGVRGPPKKGVVVTVCQYFAHPDVTRSQRGVKGKTTPVTYDVRTNENRPSTIRIRELNERSIFEGSGTQRLSTYADPTVKPMNAVQCISTQCPFHEHSTCIGDTHEPALDPSTSRRWNKNGRYPDEPTEPCGRSLQIS